jgi:hypothetical protein
MLFNDTCTWEGCLDKLLGLKYEELRGCEGAVLLFLEKFFSSD